MPLPSNLETCIVKGTYKDFSGAPAEGGVILKFPVFVRDPGADTILVPFDIVAPLDGNGSFSVTIPVNDDPDADPVGWELTVKEDFPGGRTFSFPVPSGTGTLDLADITASSPVPDPGETMYASFAALSAEVFNRQQADLELDSDLRDYVDATLVGTVQESERNLPGGFAGLDGDAKIFGAQIQFGTPTPAAVADAASAGVAGTPARSDHVHPGVALTGAQTVAGVKTFSSIPVLPATDPTTGNQAVRKAYVDALDAAMDTRVDAAEASIGTLNTADGQNVKLTGAQSIAGVKTFSSIPVLPASDPTASEQATRKAYVDAGDATAVKLTGAQSISGLKTFTQIALSTGTDATVLQVEQTNTGAAAGVMKLIGGSATNQAFLGTYQGAATNSWSIRSDGRFEMGDATAARDTFLSRAAAAVLQVTSQVRVTGAAPSNAADLTRKDYVDAADALKVNSSLLGAASGVATLDSSGRLPATQRTIMPMAIVEATAYSLASSVSTYTALSFATCKMSTQTGLWAVSPNPTRIVLPSTGTYDVSGFVVWPGTLGSADGRGYFALNGTEQSTARLSITKGSSGNAAATASGSIVCTSAGQYVELMLNQNSGSACSMIASIGVRKVSDSTVPAT